MGPLQTFHVVPPLLYGFLPLRQHQHPPQSTGVGGARKELPVTTKTGHAVCGAHHLDSVHACTGRHVPSVPSTPSLVLTLLPPGWGQEHTQSWIPGRHLVGCTLSRALQGPPQGSLGFIVSSSLPVYTGTPGLHLLSLSVSVKRTGALGSRGTEITWSYQQPRNVPGLKRS